MIMTKHTIVMFQNTEEKGKILQLFREKYQFNTKYSVLGLH